MQTEHSAPSIPISNTILRVVFTSLLMFGFQTFAHTFNAHPGTHSTTNLMERVGYSVFMGLMLGWVLPWMAHRWPNAWLFRWKIRR